MPQFVWIIICATAVPLVAIVTFVLLKRGGSVAFGKNSLTIPSGQSIVVNGSESDTSTPIGKALRYVGENVNQIEQAVFGMFLRLMKDNGVADDRLTQHEDSRYAALLIKTATSLGNGSPSVQKLLENQITFREFCPTNVSHYVRAQVVPQVIAILREHVNARYGAVIHVDDGYDVPRKVSPTEFADMLLSDKFADVMTDRIIPFFSHAAECLEGETA